MYVGVGVCVEEVLSSFSRFLSPEREREKEVPSPPSLRPPKEMVTLDPGAQILSAWSGGSTVLCLMYGPCFRVRQTGFSS